MNEKQLLDLKRQIDSAKQQQSELVGRKKHLMQQLKNDWNCSSIEDADKHLLKLKKDYANIEDQIQEKLDEIEEQQETIKI